MVRRLIAERSDQSVVSGLSRRVLPGTSDQAAATLVALWSSYTALVLSSATALFYVVGNSLFERD